jgi:hypothetical protein
MSLFIFLLLVERLSYLAPLVTEDDNLNRAKKLTTIRRQKKEKKTLFETSSTYLLDRLAYLLGKPVYYGIGNPCLKLALSTFLADRLTLA